MKSVLLTLAFMLVYTCSHAQATPEEITTKFFSLYKSGDSNKSVDYLFTNSDFSKDIADGIDDLKRQLKKQIDADGKFLGADLLSKRVAGPNYVIYSYLVRHQREPLTFNFIFYKASDKWQLQNFKYHNKTDEELEEAVKVYHSKANND
ncbi:hypothetical protein [Hymenobacter gelipurpurascens]|nr:hypothetical protein [Hymenobacter gelipurpurascens]